MSRKSYTSTAVELVEAFTTGTWRALAASVRTFAESPGPSKRGSLLIGVALAGSGYVWGMSNGTVQYVDRPVEKRVEIQIPAAAPAPQRVEVTPKSCLEALDRIALAVGIMEQGMAWIHVQFNAIQRSDIEGVFAAQTGFEKNEVALADLRPHIATSVAECRAKAR